MHTHNHVAPALVMAVESVGSHHSHSRHAGAIFKHGKLRNRQQKSIAYHVRSPKRACLNVGRRCKVGGEARARFEHELRRPQRHCASNVALTKYGDVTAQCVDRYRHLWHTHTSSLRDCTTHKETHTRVRKCDSGRSLPHCRAPRTRTAPRPL